MPSGSTIHPQRKTSCSSTSLGGSHHIHNVGASSGMARFLSRSSTGIRVTEPAPTARRDEAGSAGAGRRHREHAEHLLQEAQATIHDLQTKLAHERLARDEAIQRADGEKQVVEQALQRVRDELAVERDCRQKAEQERDDAIAARQEAEERLREVLAAQDAQKASQAAPRRPTNDPQTTRRPRRVHADDRALCRRR